MNAWIREDDVGTSLRDTAPRAIWRLLDRWRGIRWKRTVVADGFSGPLDAYSPVAVLNDEMGLTQYIHEDVAYIASPAPAELWRKGETTNLPGHCVDALLALDDRRLVGVTFWSTPNQVADPLRKKIDDLTRELVTEKNLSKGWSDLASEFLANSLWITKRAKSDTSIPAGTHVCDAAHMIVTRLEARVTELEGQLASKQRIIDDLCKQ